MHPCTCCFTDTLAKCETGIKLNIILPVYGDYRWVITDKFGHKYQGTLADDHIIPVDELPAGLLTQYSGAMKLEIFEAGTEDCGPEKFLVAGRYDCIEFEITGGTFEKNNLGCAIEAAAESSYTEYIATLSQSGTDDPTANIIVNSTGATFELPRVQEGTYNIVSAGFFTPGDIAITASAGITVTPVSVNEIQITVSGDDVLNGSQFIHIKKY